MRKKYVQNYVHTPDQMDDIKIKIQLVTWLSALVTPIGGKKANAINNAHKGQTKC